MEKKRTRLTRQQRNWRLITLIVVPVLAVLAVGIVPVWRRYRAERDVDILALGLRGFAAENGRPPSGTRAQIAALLRGEDVAGLNPKKLDYVVANMGEMNANGEFIDPWGTPYRLSDGPGARAYSCGPNRQDEGGSGDDICSWRK
jgi:type II secretory pathway pseudopilin PulG